MTAAVGASSFATTAVPARSQEAGSLHWVHADDTFATHAALVDANRDDTPDVVVGSGDRIANFAWLVPPGHPLGLLNLLRDDVSSRPAKLVALDGASGEPLWEVEWAPLRTGDDAPIEVLHDLDAGDFDGDGRDEVLVNRTTFSGVVDRIPEDVVHRTTAYDAVTGEILWEDPTVLPPDQAYYSVDVHPVEIGGRRLAIFTSTSSTTGGKDVSSAWLTDLTGPARVELARLARFDGFVFWEVAASARGVDLFGIRHRLVEGETLHWEAAGIEATRIVDRARGPRARPLWSNDVPASPPLDVVGGRDPIAVFRSGDELVAVDASTGRERWRTVAEGEPSTVAAFQTKKGERGIAWSPLFGSDLTSDAAYPFASTGPGSEVFGLDATSGEGIWRAHEPLAKFGSWGLDAADVDGVPGDEMIVPLSHQDGFPFTSSAHDDHGLLTVVDPSKGQTSCRFSTDRVAAVVLPVDLDPSAPGRDLFVTTFGGTTYAFRLAEPSCGPLAALP